MISRPRQNALTNSSATASTTREPRPTARRVSSTRGAGALAFVGATAGFLTYGNPWPLILSVPVLLFLSAYPLLKRFTRLCHYYLGAALALAPVCAWIAIRGNVEWPPVLMALAVLTWTAGFDIIYALQDVDFDRSQHLHSIPAWLGKANALKVSEWLHLFSAACVVFAGIEGNFHFLYWTGVAIFTGMLLYQHSIVKPDDLRKVNLAFMTANGIASVLFAVFVITDLLVSSS